jgi:hypothetical protein
MSGIEPVRTDDLGQALTDILQRPIKTLVPAWSWKAAALSALVRAATFFFTNLSSGQVKAFRAMGIEAVFAILAAGLMGAVAQRLRRSEPLWGTIGIVCLGPAVMVTTQVALHRLAKTPNVTGGLMLAFCSTAVTSAFGWYAMRHGAMLGGADATTVKHDIRALPRITFHFITAVPRALLGC